MRQLEQPRFEPHAKVTCGACGRLTTRADATGGLPPGWEPYWNGQSDGHGHWQPTTVGANCPTCVERRYQREQADEAAEYNERW